MDKETTVDKPKPRSYTEISQPLRDAKEKGLIADFAWYSPFRGAYGVKVCKNDGSTHELNGNTMDIAYDKSAAYVATLEKPTVIVSTTDHASDALAYLAETVKATEPRYLHLRRRDMETGEYMQTGGITLAFIRVGRWYKVGAAFCSLKDTYQKDGVANGKPVGRRLAKARLWTSPCWIHDENWTWHQIPSHLTTKEGRAWLDHALRKGMVDWWDLAPKHKEEKVAAKDTVYAEPAPNKITLNGAYLSPSEFMRLRNCYMRGF